MTADLKAAVQADRLTGVQRPLAAVGGAPTGPTASARVNGVVAAIAALPTAGVSWEDYEDIGRALALHLIYASREADRVRRSYEGHGLLDAAHEVENLIAWFRRQADDETSGAADAARARYYVTRTA